MLRAMLAALVLASPLNAQVVSLKTSVPTLTGAPGVVSFSAPALSAGLSAPALAPGLAPSLAPSLVPVLAAPAVPVAVRPAPAPVRGARAMEPLRSAVKTFGEGLRAIPAALTGLFDGAAAVGEPVGPAASAASPVRSLESIKELKMGSYNVLNLFENVGKHVPDPENPGKLKKISDARPKEDRSLREQGQVILENDLDIVTLEEVENIAALRDFNERFLDGKYSVHLIEGNDERGIDVAFLVKKDLPFLVEHRSHKDETWVDPVLGGGPRTLFSRDLTSLVVRVPGKAQPLFVLFGTHYKSKRDRDGGDPGSSILRGAQVQRSAEIIARYRAEFGADTPIMLAGDFNGEVGKDAEFRPLFEAAGLVDSFDASPNPPSEKDRITHTFHPQGAPAHFGQMDAVLVSKALRGAVRKAEAYRYKNEDGSVRAIPATYAERSRNPSDHFPVIVTLDFAALRGPASFAEIPEFDERYTGPESRARTVTILGSSKSVDPIKEQVALSGEVSGALIRHGYNVLTGAGNAGVMGAAYAAAAENANAAPRRGENLVLAVRPGWGDENLSDARAIGIADSEPRRVEAFAKVSDNFLIFPGSAGSIQEAAILVAMNAYRGKAPLKRIILVGRDFFGGISQQYQRLFADGLLKEAPEALFTVVDTAEEILAGFLPAAPKPDAELEAFAAEHLKGEKDAVLRERAMALVRAYLSAPKPRREAAYALSTAYYDGVESLERPGAKLEPETKRQLEAMLAVLDSVVPRAKARRYQEPEINRLVNAFEPLLGAFDRRGLPPETPPAPPTPSQSARLFADGARNWLASSGAAFDAKNAEWARWTENPGPVSAYTAGNVRPIRSLIDRLQVAKLVFAAEAAAVPANGELSPETVRRLYNAWDRLREAANDTLRILGDSSHPDPSQRGLVSNADQNTGRTPGGLELFLAPGRAVDWDAARVLNEALR
ncbi:MAG: LOG family protein [Elusimicrobia bacterium]|nr:LOG family protein [Elusimicrobiota bacterium]